MKLITGACGQLGTALAEVFPDARAVPRTEWDVAEAYPLGERPHLVLHAAAWTKVEAGRLLVWQSAALLESFFAARR